MSSLCLLVLWFTFGGFPTAVSHADPYDRMPPLPGELIRGFQIAEHNWEPGHRGVDLAADAGSPVVAAADGIVSWIGVIDHVPMLTVLHPDGLRSTYQPIDALVSTDQHVHIGQVIGIVAIGHCEGRTCLHWGIREGETYLDPIVWLGAEATGSVRLLPRSAVPITKPISVPVGQTDTNQFVGDMPVDGPVTDTFGSRINPISGASEFHDGIDIGASCGSPVHSLLPGTVTFAGVAGGYGNRIEIDHGVIDGAPLQTSYSHLSVVDSSVGQQVSAGTVIGQVGTTGYSTGCHLHYSAVLAGEMIDPRSAPTR